MTAKNTTLLMLIFAILFPTALSAQTSEEKLTGLLPDSVGGYTKSGEDEFYNSRNIQKYFNEEAEIYLSYGINLVLIRKYIADNQSDIKVSIYEMNSSYSAYGIYSMSRKSIENDYGQGSYQENGAILFWKSHYFITINTSSEIYTSMNAAEELAWYIDSSIDTTGGLPPLLQSIPEEYLLEETVKYYSPGLFQSTYSLLFEENIFNFTESTQCVLALYEIGSSKPVVMIFEYADASDVESTIKSLKFKFGYADLDDGTAIRVDDNNWFRMNSNGNIIYMVMNSGDVEVTKKLIRNLSAQVQNYIDNK